MMKTREKGGDAGERLLACCRIRSDDWDDAGGGAIFWQLAPWRVGAIKTVIGTRTNLDFDRGSAADNAIEKDFARHSRRPNIFGAKQDQEWDLARPAGLPPIVTGCRIKR